MELFINLVKRTVVGMISFQYKLRHIPIGCYAWLLNHEVPRASYNLVDERGLSERCRGDTLFILGSGASLAQLDQHQIDVMSRNTTMSFNYTAIQAFIPIDFHVVREIYLLEKRGKGKLVSVSLENSFPQTHPTKMRYF